MHNEAAADQEDEAAADQEDEEEYEADSLQKSREHQRNPLGRPAQERRG